MNRPTSQADVMADWEELLDAVAKNPDVQPSVEPERQSLAQLLTEMQDLKARQNELRGLSQQNTQRLAAVMVQGTEAALKVRSVVKGKVGPKSELLVHFKITPLRKRKRKAKEKPNEPPAERTAETLAGPEATPSGGSAA